jgi:hypothetical protein
LKLSRSVVISLKRVPSVFNIIGHVYISGYDSDDIHRLSPDGTLRDIVLSKHDGVDGPSGITFNNDFTKLFIINGGMLFGS